MSETSSRASYEQGHNATVSAQGPAGRAVSEKAARQRIILATGGILLVLALAVVLLRLQRLDELPLGLHHDEGTHGVDALRVLQGKHAVFFPANNGREGLIVYTIALAISFLGRTMLALRLPQPWPAPARSLSSSGWDGCSLAEMKAGGSPRGAACWSAESGPVCWRYPSARRLLGGRRSEPTSCHCFFACVWPCSGGGGSAGSGGGSRWRGRVPGCCHTPILRRVSHLSYFSFLV